MQAVNFLKKIFETDDLDFYNEFLHDKSIEELKKFWDNNPRFLEDYPISKANVDLLKDGIYIGILHDIKKHKTT